MTDPFSDLLAKMKPDPRIPEGHIGINDGKGTIWLLALDEVEPVRHGTAVVTNADGQRAVFKDAVR